MALETRPDGLEARFLQPIDRRYRAVVADPVRLIGFSIGGIAILAVGGAMLFVFAPAEDFWKVFDHVFALLAGVGLLLALPALGIAAHTDRALEHLSVNLSGKHNLSVLPPDDREPLSEGQLTPMHGTSDAPAGGGELPPSLETPASEPQPGSLAPWLGRDSGAHDDPTEVPAALSRFALEAAIGASADPGTVSNLLSNAQVFVLGNLAGDTSVPGHGTQTDLLHFEVEDRGHDIVMLPVFTRGDVLSDALIRNPEWQSLSKLEINGRELLENRDDDVTLVIDPWSAFEFQLPP